MNLLTALLTIAAIGSSHQAVFNVNKMVDNHLMKVREKTRQQGKEVITIPNINKEWKERLGFVKVTCNFECEGGWLKNMSTIRRAGDVTLRTIGDKFILTVKMGFDEVAAHYDSCRFEAKRIGRSTHKVEISTSDIIVDAQATLTHDGVNCNLHIDRVHVESMGDLRFHTGDGFIQKVRNKLFDILAHHFDDEVKEGLAKALESRLTDVAEESNICERLPF